MSTTLQPGEREFWLRLLDVEARAIDFPRNPAPAGPAEVALSIEERGPLLPPITGARGERAIAAFSGGKDSLVQAGLLREVTGRPILISINSTLPPHVDLEIPRRAEILHEIQRRLDVALIEARSDLRGAWNNHYPRTAGYDTTVNELADVFLYLGALVAAGYALDAPHLAIAGELEGSLAAVIDGRLVLGRFFMLSAPVMGALDRLLQRIGMRYSSTIASIPAHLVGRLLWTRYREIADLQYSCWLATDGKNYCNECLKCWGVAGWLIPLGVWPGVIGMDVVALLNNQREWSPPAAEPGTVSPTNRYFRWLAMRSIRLARAKSTVGMATFIARHQPGALLRRSGWRAVLAYRGIRKRALAARDPESIGFSPSYVRFMDPLFRDGVARIFGDALPANEGIEPAEAERTMREVEWIAEPLSSPSGH